MVVEKDPRCKEAQIQLDDVQDRMKDREGLDGYHRYHSDEDWPYYGDEPWDGLTEPDSNDSEHAIPCRFYNHEGCSKAGNCLYSHAPDDRSIRDVL